MQEHRKTKKKEKCTLKYIKGTLKNTENKNTTWTQKTQINTKNIEKQEYTQTKNKTNTEHWKTQDKQKTTRNTKDSKYT